jgi:hypothetical protein
MAIPPPGTLASFWTRAQREAVEADAARLGAGVVPAIELGEYDHALDLLDLQCKQRSGFKDLRGHAV